jgi:hypothetical protein
MLAVVLGVRTMPSMVVGVGVPPQAVMNTASTNTANKLFIMLPFTIGRNVFDILYQ